MQELNDIGFEYQEFGVEKKGRTGMTVLFLHLETNAIGNECFWFHGLIDSVMKRN